MCAAEKRVGGANAGLAALMLANVPPLAKPLWKAAFAAAAAPVMPPGAGLSGCPVSWKSVLNGGFERKLSTIVAGKASANRPTPPRMTLTLLPEVPCGFHANPMRGCQEIAW